MLDRLAFAALWLTVFSIPWEDVVALPWLDPSQQTGASRIPGLAAAGLALVSIAARGRIRLPGRFQLLALLFLLWAATTMIWSLDPLHTTSRVTTYVQLVVLAAMVWQLAATEARQLALYQAYVLGACISAAGTVGSYLFGEALEGRYTTGDFNMNDLGFTLVLALPMAWYLSVARPGTWRVWVNRLYLPLGVVAILLTGSRGAFIPGFIALMLVPWSMTHLRASSRVAGTLVLTALLAAAAMAVPPATWERLGETRAELESGTLTHRREIWRVGVEVAREHPVVGVGAGGFEVAAAPYLDRPRASHNTYISILVEQGMVGLGIFALLLVAALLPACARNTPARRFWIVMSCVLLVGLVPRNWDYRKATWFVLASAASHGALLIPPRQPRSRIRVLQPPMSGLARAPSVALPPMAGAGMPHMNGTPGRGGRAWRTR